MAGKNILEGSGDESQEILRSVEELAAKQGLDKLRNDLEEKKLLISDLLNDLKPLEDDIARRENAAEALRQRVDDQASRIESLSKDLFDDRKRLQELAAANGELRKKVAEKDAIITVLRGRLEEKTSSLRELDRHNHELEQDIDSYRKKVFSLENKVGAVEKSVFSTNEQNQKLLYELMRFKERVKALESEIADKDMLLEDKDARFSADLAALKKEEDEKKAAMMKSHSKKVAAMNAAVAALKNRIFQQQKVMDARARKENELISDFNSRMRDILESKEAVPFDIGDVAGFSEGEAEGQEADREEGGGAGVNSGRVGEPEGAGGKASGESGGSGMMSFELPEAGEEGLSRIDEIIPMIELAMDHGDDIRTIRHSLHSSGYSEKDVSDALEKLNLS